LGEAPDELPPLEANAAATETVWLVARQQSKYWKNVDPKACEPREGQSGQIKICKHRSINNCRGRTGHLFNIR
jgi:hypothetical protein